MLLKLKYPNAVKDIYIFNEDTITNHSFKSKVFQIGTTKL